MKLAAKRGELTLSQVALSVDRDLVADNKKQLYGSQFHFDSSGKLVPQPIEDEENVDHRRAAMGMISFTAYKSLLQK